MQIIKIPGKDALTELYKRIADHPDTGVWPVILGDEDAVDLIEETQEMNADDEASEEEVIRAGAAIDAATWLAKVAGEQYEDDEYQGAEEGEWPAGPVAPMGIITHQDILSGKPLDEVTMGLFRVDESWKVFAKLAWGNWNACPAAEEHCAVHAYWGRKYGSQVVSVTGDIVQCIVANPPRDRNAAMALAREQYAYCGDIVDQGCETLANLAASLLGAKVWYFWWD
ncbi:DUF4253 domain-containing protein [Verrucomicrobiota bacterium sgz303538]